ncbi:hypothetical protein [Saccharospirillum mangrovi]|uniref:hypothetical protein n=1 Tax=Saccharospirillum mangrovi TaxID=2161747 RepID=UPI0018E5758A|nr:hypothetical protein [Saccharospirillum mangrovi]
MNISPQAALQNALKQQLQQEWRTSLHRLRARQLLQTPSAWLALRVPGVDGFWFGSSDADQPQWMPIAGNGNATLAAHLLRSRPDVGAIATGCGRYGQHLFDVHGRMPGVFDEQVRHLGKMRASARNDVAALELGGNVHWLAGQPLLLGMSANRLVLNAELFEKCAKAYVLAAATGQRVKPLPWLVRVIANRRLINDEKAAAARFVNGELPEDSRPY